MSWCWLVWEIGFGTRLSKTCPSFTDNGWMLTNCDGSTYFTSANILFIPTLAKC